MEFIALPPEVTSALIHSGPGAGSLVEASGAWQRLGTDLEDYLGAFSPVLASLTEAWHGPSSSAMVRAVMPHLSWVRATAQQCQQLGSSAQSAAVAFSTTLAAVAHPSEVKANRIQLARLEATNRLGRNLAAIAETETQYQEMWVNNSAAMYRYGAASAQALELSGFLPPPAMTNQEGPAAQASLVPAASANPAASVMSWLTKLVDNGWFQLANTYANQLISSGFPINLLELAAQSSSAVALQSGLPGIDAGLAEGESALGAAAASLTSATRAIGAGQAPTAALGVGVTVGKLTAPPAAVGLLPASPAPVQLASAVSPLPAGSTGLPMLPMMPPPIAAGSGWRKRKEQKYADIAYGLEVRGAFMPRPPSAG